MSSDERIKALAALKTKQIMKERKKKTAKRPTTAIPQPKVAKKGKRNKIIS